MIPVGGVLVRLEVAGEGNAAAADHGAVKSTPAAAPEPEPDTEPEPGAEPEPVPAPVPAAKKAGHRLPRPEGAKPLASPSVRARARAEGVNLRQVPGSGPAGRISHEDLDNWIASGGIQQGGVTRGQNTGIEEVRVVGMRRRIAQKMALSKRQIPHITIVEEVEMSALEDLRAVLNAKHADARPKLTLLPFLILVRERWKTQG